ncbi:2-C-methyl-D-erythritol 4-phosphate cytidylyltransferase [Jeotgalicoccus saudimassiliensis]|uniref:2-C-methyl-D-erythritol 4-phosphate cytidylyltransferase n=1 Tax=Jeotgalicoccus saudimassiliensis TaxID=1461582 RepID=A0A078M952_9STAP|nr:2-C-methyl-D-erythritol 4-phosphate cytidylyltransferase [Jeotgalicoccus saudimassiliensis]CEA02769.1 2-C-methyl-D-erythritol 4-phosphate cytidylyltransferase [Jeotgalicoccus saudimassiliensis]
MKYTVIIPAAGMGARMGLGFNKVLLEIEGEPVIKRTVRQFTEDPDCEAIHLAVRAGETEVMAEMFSDNEKIAGIHLGGAERQDSIYNALVNVENADYVFVHDGARPFVTPEVLERLKDKVIETGAVICGVKTKDTLKRVIDGKVTETLIRDEVVAVHTPQAFEYRILKQAYAHAKARNLEVTDDSMMVEATGKEVYLVESTYDNIKITTSEDLQLAHMILKGK